MILSVSDEKDDLKGAKSMLMYGSIILILGENLNLSYTAFRWKVVFWVEKKERNIRLLNIDV